MMRFLSILEAVTPSTAVPLPTAVSRLTGLAGVIPSLNDAAAGANFIYHLPDRGAFSRTAALETMVGSRAVRSTLATLSAEQLETARRVISSRTTTDQILSPSRAQVNLEKTLSGSGKLPNSGANRIRRAALTAVAEAGGLPRLVIRMERAAFQHHPYDISEKEENVLWDLEQELLQSADTSRIEERMEILESLRGDVLHFSGRAERLYDQGGLDRSSIDFIGRMTQIRLLITKKYPPSLWAGGRYPEHLYQFLFRKAGRPESSGHCFPIHFLAAHLASLTGMKVHVLNHFRHINLFDRQSQLVFNFGLHRLLVSTLGDWEEIGRWGRGQEPAPLQALIASMLLNVGSHMPQCEFGFDMGLEYLAAGLSVWPDDPDLLLALLSRWSDHPERMDILRKIIQLNPRIPDAYAKLGVTYAGKGRVAKSREAFQKALLLIRINPKAAARIFGEETLSSVDEDLARQIRERLQSLAE